MTREEFIIAFIVSLTLSFIYIITLAVEVT
jgi:hypothetical protein